ncbi:hypothetical protein JHK85_017546 [Glycine max]|nr:hypothetical protein JHK85_017546 [Glycine max]KAG5047761.1 hypothetical protein JHK86_017167 [Glycine max]
MTLSLNYAWVGNSEKQCLEVCAYPFAVPGYMGSGGPGHLIPSNGDIEVDDMYADEDPTAPTEIEDLYEGLYEMGGGGGYIGSIMKDDEGRTFNLNGRNGRKFLVQWIWSPILKACAGPNALD